MQRYDGKALGMIEYRTVPSGMAACDMITKAAEIDIVLAEVVSPGKYLAMFSGELAAVKTAVDAAKSLSRNIIGHFVLGNPHGSLFEAVSAGCRSMPEDIGALGIIETKTAVSAILVGDSAAKSAVVKLAEIRLAKGMCGKAYVLLSGTVANVQEAVEISSRAVDSGKIIDTAVIPRPSEKFWNSL